MVRRRDIVAAALLLTASVAYAAPVGRLERIIEGPLDQSDPSINGPYVVYASETASGSDILLYDVVTRATMPVAADPAVREDSPDVFNVSVAYRTPAGIAVYARNLSLQVRAPGERGAANPTVSNEVVAWEVGNAGARDVGFDRYGLGGASGLIGGAGDQFAPAAAGGLLAYVDGAARGAVLLHDTLARTTRLVCDGEASGVAMELATRADGTEYPVLAVARGASGATDSDVEVWDASVDPPARRAALAVAGAQVNPHLSREWVAFEDLSTGHSQVVLWNWRTGVVYVPFPSDSEQILNDVSTVDAAVRVVFADDAAGDLDIALYTLPLPFADDGAPSTWPPSKPPPPAAARCDDLGADVLALLDLERGTSKRQSGSVALELGPAGERVPVLVCLDADRVSAAWVTLDDVAVATPSEFVPAAAHVELATELPGASHAISGVIAGKPGATLRIRVLADPTRAPSARDDADAGITVRDAAGWGSGCSSGGAGGLGALAGLVLVALVRRGRRV